MQFIKLPALLAEIDHTKVPYKVRAIHCTEHKVIVYLRSIQTKFQAYALRNAAIFLPASLQDILLTVAVATPGNFLMGFMVEDLVLGYIGKICNIYCVREGYYMMEVDFKNHKKLLIPYPIPFPVTINQNDRKIDICLPEGYVDAILL